MALEFLRDRTAAEAAWRHSGEILSGLLSGSGGGSKALVAQAASLGHDLSQPHAMIVARFDLAGASEMPHRLASTFTRLSEHTNPKPLLGMHAGYVVAAWPLGREPLESARAASDQIRRTVADGTHGSGPASSAITGPVSDPGAYAESFAIARGAVELAALHGIGGKTLVLADLGMSGLFLQLQDLPQLKSYCDQVLGPLREYDGSQGTSLLETLAVLIRNDLNARATSEQMFVHKNTVVQRRRRIEELLGRELTNVAALADIATALNLADVIRAKET
jgi:sugar diacid utilization regulator